MCPKHEYEFRLVVCSFKKERIDKVFNNIANLCNGTMVKNDCVFYAKPNFRFRNNRLEIKKLIEAEAVYYEGFWFRWVHSIEVPFEDWKINMHEKFVVDIGNAQDAFVTEKRQIIHIDKRTQVYTFYCSDGTYRIIFEWEYGSFPTPLKEHYGKEWLKALSKYKHIFECFYGLNYPPYTNDVFSKQLCRKKVTCIRKPLNGKNIYVAHKYDGIFGFIYSYRDRLKEKWEGHKRRVRMGITFGDGIVFAAEKLSSKAIILLDVYAFRGENVAPWCKQAVLTQYLPFMSKSLPPEYKVQQYIHINNINYLPKPMFKTDGIIFHDVLKDEAYKMKSEHTIDVLYRDDYFWLMPIEKRFKCNKEDVQKLQNNCIYELSANDGHVIKIRNDRFTGNSMNQLLNVFDCNSLKWSGEPLEDLPKPKVKKNNRKRKRGEKF